MTDLHDAARLALSLMDLTTLNDSDTDAVVTALCQQAKQAVGMTAAVCVYPQFIGTAQKALAAAGAQAVKIATVTNFPHGRAIVVTAVEETQQAVAMGADEVDVVFPYQALMAGDAQIGLDLVRQCKAVCPPGVALKVIIESGELKAPALIRQASELAIDGGADFIKTSTGKVAVNATLEAAEIMLTVISEKQKPVGFKAAGGIKTVAQAAEYLALAERIMGKAWISPGTFRFGASSLLNDILNTLGIAAVKSDSAY